MGFVRKLAARNLLSDRFGTLCAIVGVALGTATVDTILVLDVNTERAAEIKPEVARIKDLPLDNPPPEINPEAPREARKFAEGTVRLVPRRAGEDRPPALAAAPSAPAGRKDYEVMRSAIRLGSLSAFLVGAMIVLFTFAVIVERRKREVALLRSLGALPGQVAQVILLEAIVIGGAGGLLGLVASVPMSLVATSMGFTTTGRAVIYDVRFPWPEMIGMSALGGVIGVLGIIRPALSILRLDVARTLMPRALSDRAPRRQTSRLIAALVIAAPVFYALVARPILQSRLTSLPLLVAEAGMVCAAFFVLLVTVPEIVRWLGTGVSALIPAGPRAARLLVLRRIQNMSHELAWSVGGLMLVAAMVLALHLVTQSLKNEITSWSARAIRPYTFIYNTVNGIIPRRYFKKLPDTVAEANFTARTPWPNPVYAVDRTQLIGLLKAGGDPQALELGQRLGPGKVILSRMMGRRLDLDEGDALVIDGVGGRRALEVVAVTDRVGYVPAVGPYRNTKVYALLDHADYDLIRPYAADLGSAIVLAEPGVPQPRWVDGLDPIETYDNAYIDTGLEFAADRVREANRDFAIFDLILLLTTLLAAIGVANNMLLAAHGRRRELAIYRVLGMTRRQLSEVFLVEGAFIGALGGALAVGLGSVLGTAAIAALRQVSSFDVRFELPWTYALFTVAGATVVSTVAVIYPAARASITAGSAESIHYE